MKHFLESGKNISIMQTCGECKIERCIKINPLIENSVVKLEHRFKYNGNKIADVAYLQNNEIKYIFEICHTHKTKPENRPHPWFEISALDLANLADSENDIILKCMRNDNCIYCSSDDELENYIRKTLGQKIHKDEECACGNDCKDCEGCDRASFDPECRFCPSCKSHKRLEFHAENDYENNKNIVNYFNDASDIYKFAMYTRKGTCDVAIMYACDYEKYNDEYWNGNNYKYPHLFEVTFNGIGIVELLRICIKILKECEKCKNLHKDNDIVEIFNKWSSGVEVCEAFPMNEINSHEVIYLKVPFEEKEKAKEFKGQYHSKNKKWFIYKNNPQWKEILTIWKKIHVPTEY